jgi:RNA polymerase sigma-70 factor (ECF subfamily)
MDGIAGWGVSFATAQVMQRSAYALTELMERYAAGDDRVFELIYRQLSGPLYRFCLRLATRPPEADDLFQETFLKLHRARATYASGSNVLHWSYAIARSLYISRLRYWNSRPEQLGPAADVAEREDVRADPGATPEAHVVAEHLIDVLTLELSRMSEKNRTAYVLIREEGLTAKDAAALLGTSADVVKQRAHRACEHLKAALGDAGWREYEHPAL